MTSRFASLLLVLTLPCHPAFCETTAELTTQVREAERSFAKTMADRDLTAFASFIADDAIFSGDSALRGKTAIVAAWKSYFDGSQAPFMWKPDIVEVLDTGLLALSSGPVFDAQGKRTGTFNSIWRREAEGRWKILFDKGSCVCDQ